MSLFRFPDWFVNEIVDIMDDDLLRFTAGQDFVNEKINKVILHNRPNLSEFNLDQLMMKCQIKLKEKYESNN